MRKLFLDKRTALTLDDDDAERWLEAKACDVDVVSYEYADSTEPVAWIEVTNQDDGARWIVAPASCGLKCRCAAEGYQL